ncbi:hypothetical protein [Bacillus paranthracis]|uniref:hypothetical protein n=1 Tax=Bacillus paranthracis TaxID=2026186 RepID=UPI00202CAB35|nr:hypothetical protein [Bacillus paranthracis]
MIRVIYKHPLHGEQHYLCKQLVKSDGYLKCENIHGATFILLEPSRIIRVESE